MPLDEVSPDIHITYEVFWAQMLNVNLFKSPNLPSSLQEIQGREEQVWQHCEKQSSSGYRGILQ